MSEPMKPLERLLQQLAMSPEAEEFAGELIDRDETRLEELVTKRISSGLSIEVVAERMGVTPQHVAEFEAYWHDPKMSEVRRYEFALWSESHE